MGACCSRSGRGNQRYADDDKTVPSIVGTIPYKYNERTKTRKVLIISTQKKNKGYLFPKGGWETDESIERAANRETKEEAGVRGVLKAQLGEYTHGKNKVVHMFPLQVDKQMCCWSEIFIRRRKWVSAEEARDQLCHDYMKTALDELVSRWDQDATPAAGQESQEAQREDNPQWAADHEIYSQEMTT